MSTKERGGKGDSHTSSMRLGGEGGILIGRYFILTGHARSGMENVSAAQVPLFMYMLPVNVFLLVFGTFVAVVMDGATWDRNLTTGLFAWATRDYCWQGVWSLAIKHSTRMLGAHALLIAY